MSTELEKNSSSAKCSEASNLSASVEGGSLLLTIQALCPIRVPRRGR